MADDRFNDVAPEPSRRVPSRTGGRRRAQRPEPPKVITNVDRANVASINPSSFTLKTSTDWLGRFMLTGGATRSSVAHPALANVETALPRALRRALAENGWALAAVQASGTLLWDRTVYSKEGAGGWSEESYWNLRKAVRAYGLGTHPVGTDLLHPCMAMFKATPFVATRPVDRARTDHRLLFDAKGRLPSAALVVNGAVVLPKVPRVNTRWHERLLVEPADILGSATPTELAMWLRHAFDECGINPYPEADPEEIDGVAGPYELAYPVLADLADSVNLQPLAKVLRAAHKRAKAWSREQDGALHAAWNRVERSLAVVRR